MHMPFRMDRMTSLLTLMATAALLSVMALARANSVNKQAQVKAKKQPLV